MMLVVAFALAAGLIGVLAATTMALRRLTVAVPDEARDYLDPLPPSLRAVWPAVRFFDHHFIWVTPKSLRAAVDEQLRLTGMSFLMTARQFLSLSMVSALTFCLLAGIAMLGLGAFSPLLMIAAGALGFFYPRIWLRDVRKRNLLQITRHLPVFLDFLTLSVEAGLNINGALLQAVEKGPEGPLRREFEHVLRDLKSGLSRADALRRMDDRLRVKEVTNFVGAVIQAERTGSGLAATLRFQSEQRRTERFQRAEKQAMEAPVKLIFPLVVFIFPVTFIVLGFPIVMKFMQEGLL